MSFYRLPLHVSFGLVDDRPVFLDLLRDRYFMLDVSLEKVFGQVCAGEQSADGDEASLKRLLQTGLIVASDRRLPISPASAIAANRSLRDEPAASPSLIDVAVVLSAIFRARRQARGIPLDQVVASLGERDDLTGDRHTDRSRSLAARFVSARALVPFFAPNCLSDSLALSHLLERREAPFALVFGVKLHPFAAHCWVQVGDCVLNDGADTTRNFTPVLVV